MTKPKPIHRLRVGIGTDSWGRLIVAVGPIFAVRCTPKNKAGRRMARWWIYIPGRDVWLKLNHMLEPTLKKLAEIHQRCGEEVKGLNLPGWLMDNAK